MSNVKIFTNNIEQKAVDQINLLLEQEALKDCKVRIMPDVHAGKGCVIGFTANLGDKVIPNIVGVDIGCGMLTVELGNINLELQRLDEIIKKNIPSGRNIHEANLKEMDKITELICYKNLKDTKKFNRAIGTLGGGNHFIEVEVDENDNKYLVIHTGSRNMGNQVANYYQNLAIELCSGKEEMFDKKQQIIKEYKEQERKSEIAKALKKLEKEYSHTNLPSDLCYLTGKYREMYLHDMAICQEYASLNRYEIAEQILFNYFGTGYTQLSFVQGIWKHFETIHNYIDLDSNIVRKGAISAKQGERVIIPINMRDGCIIARGKGNDDWNCSAPHGAGRLMSRTQAKRVFNLEDFAKSMDGIYTSSVNESTLDEAPFAYKPMREIIDNIGDTVEIEKIIKPIYNFKASE